MTRIILAPKFLLSPRITTLSIFLFTNCFYVSMKNFLRAVGM